VDCQLSKIGTAASLRACATDRGAFSLSTHKCARTVLDAAVHGDTTTSHSAAWDGIPVQLDHVSVVYCRLLSLTLHMRRAVSTTRDVTRGH